MTAAILLINLVFCLILAGELCMAEGGALFLAVPLAVFLPSRALQNKGGRS